MKSRIWLIVISFIPFSMLGFLFADISNHAQAQTVLAPQETTPVIRTQTNILFVSVDKNAKPYPRLVSVWGLFFSSKGQNVAEFINLFPSTDALKDTLLASEFVLEQTKTLDPKFFELAKKYYQVDWDNYVLMDTEGINNFSNELGSSSSTMTGNPSSIFSDQSSAKLLFRLCNTLKSDNPALDLKNILNIHTLNHNFSLSDLSSFQKWIQMGQPFTSCELLQ